jgi:hypothetical protein
MFGLPALKIVWPDNKQTGRTGPRKARELKALADEHFGFETSPRQAYNWLRDQGECRKWKFESFDRYLREKAAA